MTSPQVEPADDNVATTMATTTSTSVADAPSQNDNVTTAPSPIPEVATSDDKIPLESYPKVIETTLDEQQPTITEAPPDDVAKEEFMGEPAVPEVPNMSSMDMYSSAADMDALNAMAFSQPGDYSLGMNGLPMTDANGIAALQMAMHGNMMDDGPMFEETPRPPIQDETRISAYAKLEFLDGEFYMNTHRVILGRDQAAAKAARKRDEEELRRAEMASTMEPKTPIRIKREESRYTKSIISESGGILREDNGSDSDARIRKRKSRKASKKSRSTRSNSDGPSRRNSEVQPNGFIRYKPQEQVPIRHNALDDDRAAALDPASLRPSPHGCPLIGIHPPAATPHTGYKAISRKHVMIAYNFKSYLFEAQIIGRNGAFIDDQFYHHAEVIPLKSGSQLQIGGVVVKFVLPDVAIGETGAETHQETEEGEEQVAERYSEGGKEMSFDFDDRPREGVQMNYTSEDEEEEEQKVNNEEEEEEEEIEGDIEEEEEEGEEDMEEEQQEFYDQSEERDAMEEDAEEGGSQDPMPNPLIPKKRGPGRPPKNGIMSKREQQLAKREAQMKAKAAKTVPESTSGKNKVGRPRKHPLPEEPIKTEKRKYTKRKPKDPESPTLLKREVTEGDGDGQGSPGDAQSKKEKKEKSMKPPRSPSPVFNEADLTPEQLAKPQANYVNLIHEALSNSPTGQMSLPQIYRAIQRRYPFFVLKCNTNGWQSSVRHNLSQHHAFTKVERDGKGWMWAIVDGVSIEKEKKRRVTPPPQMGPGHMHHQPIYRAGPPHMMPMGYPGMMGPPPPGFMPHPGFQGPHPHFSGPPHFMPQGPPPANGQLLPPGIPPVLGANAPGTYSSPYAPKPAPPPPPAQQPQQQQQQPPNLAAPQSGPPQNPTQPQTQQMQAPPQQGPPRVPAPPPATADHMSRAIDLFVTTMKSKIPNADAVIASAVNRVKGVTVHSTTPGNPMEETIMNALRNMLSKIPGAVYVKASPAQPQNQARPVAPQQQQQAPPVQHHLPQTQSQPPPQQAQSQGQLQGQTQGQPQSQPSPIKQQVPPAPTATPQSNTPATINGTTQPRPAGPTIMRPNFGGSGQNRPSSTTVPRPPMMTPGLTRTNSGGPATTSPSRRPSSTPVVTPAAPATPVVAPETPATPASPAPLPSAGNGTPKQALPESPQTGTKRPLEDPEVNNDFKRLSNSGPPPLRT